MTEQVFADGIARIRVLNGTVRVEFGSNVDTVEGKAVLEPQVRVVMPVQGFVDAFNTMQRAMNALMQSGAVAPAGKGGEAAAGDPSPPTAVPRNRRQPRT